MSTDEAAREEIEQIVHILEMKTTSKVLDLCCGNGRHSRQLAALGFEVTGVDLSSALLKAAKETPSVKPIRYIQSDVREIHFVGEFDYVLNLFTSFGYFEEESENKKVFEAIQYALNHGGKFLIDYLNPEYVRSHLVPYNERKVEDITILETRRIEGNIVIKDIEVIPEVGEKRRYYEQVNLIELSEMKRMLSDTGLTVEHVFGGFDQSPYNMAASPRMIIVGKK